MAEGQEVATTTTNGDVFRVEERPEHGMKILQGLNKLKNDKILCDVTLIAEGRELCNLIGISQILTNPVAQC